MDCGEQQVERLFLEALQHADPGERAQFLDRTCGDDLQLRKSVEALLRANEKAGTFLDGPPTELSERVSHLSVQLVSQSEKAGDLIGRYKLLEHIGEGTFVAV